VRAFVCVCAAARAQSREVRQQLEASERKRVACEAQLEACKEDRKELEACKGQFEACRKELEACKREVDTKRTEAAHWSRVEKEVDAVSSSVTLCDESWYSVCFALLVQKDKY
jgi:hypothetical protein